MAWEKLYHMTERLNVMVLGVLLVASGFLNPYMNFHPDWI